jgi:hypothetical protein
VLGCSRCHGSRGTPAFNFGTVLSHTVFLSRKTRALPLSPLRGVSNNSHLCCRDVACACTRRSGVACGEDAMQILDRPCLSIYGVTTPRRATTVIRMQGFTRTVWLGVPRVAAGVYLVLRPWSGYPSIFSAWRALGGRSVARSLDGDGIVATSRAGYAPGGWRRPQEV